MDKPVLLTQGSSGHTTMWPALSEHFAIAFVDSRAAQVAHDIGVENVAALEGVVDNTIRQYARNRGTVLAASTLDIESYGDYSLSALKHPRILEWLPGFVADFSTNSIGMLAAIEAIADEHNVVGILTHEDVTGNGRLLALFGQSRGIPVLHMPHANHFIEAGTKDIHCSISSNYIGAAGEYMRQWYLKCGASDDMIDVIGAPHWDVLYNKDKAPTREHARRILGIGDGLSVAYATTWAQETQSWGSGQQDVDLGFLYMLDAARKLKAHMVVKMHPGEAPGREAYYGELMRKHGVSGCITRTHNTTVLKAVDCVVTQGSSNLAVEAAILGTPVAEVYQCGTKYPSKYNIPGSWGDDLDSAIRNAVDGGAPVEFAEDMNAGPGSTERAVEWVKDKCLTR